MTKELDAERNYIVYKHTSPSGKVYIGITCNKTWERWQHGKGYEGNAHFYNAIQKYGWENFKHEVLFSGLSGEEAAAKEIELIRFYHSDNRNKGYNISPGGSLVAKSTKSKIRDTRAEKGLNEKQSQRAKRFWGDPEWRKKTQENMNGKTRTEEQKEHYKSARAKQQPLSKEARERIRKALKEKTGENSVRKKAVLQIEPVTMRIVKRHPTAREAAAEVGMSINAIATICRRDIGSSKSRASHHFFWCYEEDYKPKEFEIYRGIELTENGKFPRNGKRSSMYKKTHSTLARQKISHANSIPVMCIETGMVYQSSGVAAKEYRVSRGAIYNAASGKSKSSAGLHWTFHNK